MKKFVKLCLHLNYVRSAEENSFHFDDIFSLKISIITNFFNMYLYTWPFDGKF